MTISIITLDQPAAGPRVAPAAPSMRSVAPSMRLVLADSDYRHGGQPAWSPEEALDFAHHRGIENQVADALGELTQAAAPAPYTWLTQRLGVLWTMFMVARDVDDRALTVWMAETANLLCDLPHDIVAFAIDEAIRNSPHGFIPSVGEIRKHADPLVKERLVYVERLTRMNAALADPVATNERSLRRAEQAAHEREMAKCDQEAASIGRRAPVRT